MTGNIGESMYKWASDLFPINRSITGSGVVETLLYLQTIIPKLQIKDVKSGTQAFDWVVPNEWEIKDGYIEDHTGEKIVSFLHNNLHIVGYSIPIDKIISRQELEEHIFSLPDQPTAIPYVTSYYKASWGFCMSENQRLKLGPGPFRVVIKSRLFVGKMTYGELLIPGKSKKEILLTTNICHPSLANNELSGPVVLTALANWIESSDTKNYSYRILFLPETIGSIYYISKNLRKLRKNVIAGWTLTCLGDNNAFSFIPSRHGNTITDRASRIALRDVEELKEYSWLDRGSDERQFCSPGVDLPVASIMRSKYGEYSEYHTSLDNLHFISSQGLEESYKILKTAISIVEQNYNFRIRVKCEPQLSKRGLYPAVSIKNKNAELRNQMNVVSYLDGNHDLIDIMEKCKINFDEANKIINNLIRTGLIRKSKNIAEIIESFMKYYIYPTKGDKEIINN